MHRRALLAGIGALSAGCLGVSPPRANSTTASSAATETPNSTTTTAHPTATCDKETETPSTESTGETETDAEYTLTDLTESTDIDRPSAKYILEPSAFYSSDAVTEEEERTGEEQVVKDISEIDDEKVRSAIETAIRTGEWRSNTLPDGLADTVGRVDFFTGVSEDETYTHVGLTLHRTHPDRPPALEFNAAIVDDTVSKDSPGAIALTLTNTSQTTQRVFSGTVPPFGMVYGDATEDEGRFLLWREYEEEGCVNFSERGLAVCSIGKITKLQPCERITRRYEVLPSETTRHPEYTVPPHPGRYRLTDSLDYYETRGGPESTLSFEVEFTLESMQ
ncbi:hypothetical protein E6P09_05900 [Haloferax mediterranei ATCC 33500]|uniref:DUF8130 domain-containing protein n=1 Tax=Haloferax mediterranei (strain ATCC 33500 / DSM 1411 / JCM 8866 / NBRC 14739 / NCIMB 2177 / R-4) TaxID=523841 RepID=I3R235_HALMT|nr:hypothetical protein [Haloferax mediterranei]AFK18295.1 hypothetical protein HFX_0570 [Haloferax mediterranei ATCC 33500]AHZ22305.1 hypothetical protein BM92_06400 [Haloferax mediterranei ATCC 33500]EMA02432.1 hypothetical protein C439_07615 [Haloferax mediterranei ATCC 33500]MDX5988385.1 hypothetical protein [Haloferax mediterranei ATCC 33500]QCQ74814.1 hypothetical protein E6P09_05900 [Haloferax mediterranei ATCC 33500]